MARVTDDAPFYAPNRKPPAPRQPTPGVKVWELRKDGRALGCEFRDNEKAGAGIDVQILEGNRSLLFTQRCDSRTGAEFVAASYRQDFLQVGWTE